MEAFVMANKGKVHVLRLDQGDYVLESICRLVKEKNIRHGVVVSGIGTLDQCVMHMVTTTGYPAQEYFARWENQPLELLSLQGMIINGYPHLHMVVSDKEKAYGGHLEKGCRILYLGEIVIQEIEDTDDIRRVLNEKGIMVLTKGRLKV